MSRSGLRLLGAERGQSMVEFALALPVLLVILIGVVQFALVYHARDVASTAVQEGARLAAAEGRTPAEGAVRAHEVLESGLGPSAGGFLAASGRCRFRLYSKIGPRTWNVRSRDPSA